MQPALLSLIAASLAFVGLHFAFSHPLRPALLGRLGENGFRGLYSLTALGTFIWMILAYRAVGPGEAPLWDGMGNVPWAIATIIMLVASVLLIGSFIRNPAMPDPRAAQNATAPVHGVFYVTRHPMMWAFTLWAAAHVLLSPTPRQFILAGSIAFLALVGAHMQDRKKEVLMGEAWAGWEVRTSYWPHLAGLAKAGMVAWIGGIVLWLAATYGHIHGIGIAAGIWRWVG